MRSRGRVVRRAGLALLGLLAGGLFVLAAGCGGDPPAGPARPSGYDVNGRLLGPRPAGARRPNVLLVVIDTLRADAVDPFGGGGAMPFLARWSREGVALTQASSPAPWTLPAVTSLLTGRLPSDHGITGETGNLTGLRAGATWAEILRSTLGYATVAWLGEQWPGGPGSMFEGFEEVVPLVGFQGALALLPDFARERADGRPWFLLLHSFEAHDPYGAANHPYPIQVPVVEGDPVAALGGEPEPALVVERAFTDLAFHDVLMRRPQHGRLKREHVRYLWSGLAQSPDPALAARLRAAYLEGARWVDGLLERTLAELGARGLLDDTLVVVTSDHGEAFGEHGMLGHGRRLDEELLRVPLALRGPAPFHRPLRLDASVSLIDVLPTLLAWQGLPAPRTATGRSFLPLLSAPGPGWPVAAQETRTWMRTAESSHAILESVRTAAWKLVLTYEVAEGTVTEQLFDLTRDPLEREDRLAGGAAPAEALADAAFVAAVEQARDRVWQSVGAIEPGAGRPGAVPRAPPVRTPRPPPWAPPPEPAGR